jgi:hypothetical protein
VTRSVTALFFEILSFFTCRTLYSSPPLYTMTKTSLFTIRATYEEELYLKISNNKKG